MAGEAEEIVGAPVDFVLRPCLERSPNRFARDAHPPQSFIGTRSPFLKKCVTRWRDPDDRTAVRMLGLHQSAVGRILPDRKSRAGGAPHLHRFLIAALPSSYPFQEIEDQIFNCVYHIRLISIYRFWGKRPENPRTDRAPLDHRVTVCLPVNRLDAVFSTHLRAWRLRVRVATEVKFQKMRPGA